MNDFDAINLALDKANLAAIHFLFISGGLLILGLLAMLIVDKE